MTDPTPPSWVHLLTLMVHPPDPEPTVRGSIRSFAGNDESRGYFGWSGTADDPMPVVAGLRPGATGDEGSTEDKPIKVWRDGTKLRIEEPDGSPNLIVGEHSCWQFDREHPDPIESPATASAYFGSGTPLLTRRDPNNFSGTDFTRPAGPISATTFLNRLAWTVEIAPPSHKPYPMQLIVDAETGLILQQRNDGFGSVDEWTEFVTGEPLDPALFHWSGPSRTPRQVGQDRDAEHDADMARRRDWFTGNVTALPLRTELELGVLVHEFDENTGAFQASLGEGHLGMLARRPNTDGAEWQLGWSEIQHRWADERWEWALTCYQDRLSERGLAQLIEQLGNH